MVSVMCDTVQSPWVCQEVQDLTTQDSVEAQISELWDELGGHEFVE